MGFIATSPAANIALDTVGSTTRQSEALEEEVLSLFDLLHLRLLRYAGSFGIPMQDREDVVQETFLALFHHLQRGRSRENLHGWLFRVTHNLTLKKRIRTARETVGLAPEEEERISPEPNPEECVLVSERQARFQSILHALPLKDQLCLQLRAEGLPYREIARVIGISLGSVSTSLHRSLARLREVDRR